VVMGLVIVLAGLLLGAHRLTEAGDRN